MIRIIIIGILMIVFMLVSVPIYIGLILIFMLIAEPLGKWLAENTDIELK